MIDIISVPSPIEFFVKFGQVPREVLHIGAHLAEEKNLYEELGITRSLWVEAQLDVFKKLVEIVGIQHAVNTGVWSSQKVLKFKVARNSVSSSLLDLDKKHPWEGLDFIEEIEVSTMTLDQVLITFKERGFLQESFFLLLDIQGAEYEALLGWTGNKSKAMAISCEVSRKIGYEGSRKRWRIAIRLMLSGYLPSASFLDQKTGHGDQLFLKLNTAFKNPKLVFFSIFRSTLLTLLRLRNRVALKSRKD
jgi:FkbM family methyltransferase